jgi:hypothetical protein
LDVPKSVEFPKTGGARLDGGTWPGPGCALSRTAPNIRRRRRASGMRGNGHRRRRTMIQVGSNARQVFAEPKRPVDPGANLAQSAERPDPGQIESCSGRIGAIERAARVRVLEPSLLATPEANASSLSGSRCNRCGRDGSYALALIEAAGLWSALYSRPASHAHVPGT